MSENKNKTSGNGCLISIGITIIFVVLLTQFYDVDEKTDSMTNSSWVVCSALFIGWIYALLQYTGTKGNSFNSSEIKPSTKQSYQDIDEEFRREDERRMEDAKDEAREYDPRDNLDIDETDLR